MKTKKLLPLLASALFISYAPDALQASTFDFRSNANGGNVGSDFDNNEYAYSTVDGVTILGFAASMNPTWAEFNFTAGSSGLGMGVRTGDGDLRPTQLEVGEAMVFGFDQYMVIESITLQVFFRTASNGQGGPVSEENDEIEIGFFDQWAFFASPVDFVTGGSTTYTIDLSLLGFTDLQVDPFEPFYLAPSMGDGVRLVAINASQVPDGGSTFGLLTVGLIGLAGLGMRTASRKA